VKAVVDGRGEAPSGGETKAMDNLSPVKRPLPINRGVEKALAESRSRIGRYAIALVTVALAISLEALLPTVTDPSHFTPFFAAVMVTAWYGGLGPGILATVLSAVSLDYFFIGPETFTFDWSAIVRLGVFLLAAFVVSSLTAARKRAEEALRKAHDELEMRVRERTADLAKANESLRAEVAERKRAEKELWRLQGEMGRVERLAALGRVTGSIAHELGTPLNSVLGYTQLLAQEKLSDNARRRLDIIETQVQRMGEIIQHYLSYTRRSPRKDQIKINQLIDETLVLFDPIFRQRGVRLASNLEDSLPLLWGDGPSLQRVFINLLDNALDATQEGGLLKIVTRASRSAEGRGAGITVEITDTGAGIPAEFLPKIFDLFVTTKASGKGTGFGLVVCQEIVKSHGGTIDITSHVGQGTSVRIFLPLDQSVGEPAGVTT
jgi:C4-dicarboxylate-specific signal transduction histidine kinase